jgi:T-complex protein 1 subunit theta
VDICPKEETRKPFNVDNVRVSKIIGSGALASTVVRGMVFNRPPVGSVKSMKDAKVAVYTAALDGAFTETKVCGWGSSGISLPAETQ